MNLQSLQYWHPINLTTWQNLWDAGGTVMTAIVILTIFIALFGDPDDFIPS